MGMGITARISTKVQAADRWVTLNTLGKTGKVLSGATKALTFITPFVTTAALGLGYGGSAAVAGFAVLGTATYAALRYLHSQVHIINFRTAFDAPLKPGVIATKYYIDSLKGPTTGNNLFLPVDFNWVTDMLLAPQPIELDPPERLLTGIAEQVKREGAGNIQTGSAPVGKPEPKE